MKIENLQSHNYSEESEEAAGEKTRLEQELVASIEELLATEKHKIGEGRTAEVYYPDHNDSVCYKLIQKIETFGKGVPLRYQKAQKHDRPFYNPLIKEGEFLATLKNAHTEVGVPIPHVAVSMSCTEEGNSYWVTEHIEGLLMQRLKNCSTIREIMEGELPLPETFDLEKCFRALHEFVKEMHKKNIFHRDLHDGNVMIDLKTGKAYVIDFGASIFATEEDAYRDETGDKATVYIRDEENLDKTERLLRQYLTKAKQ